MGVTKRVICVQPGTTLSYAYNLMRENAIRHLPVVEGNRLVGMVSDRDLLLYGSPVTDSELSFPALPVSRLMTTELVTAKVGTTIAETAALMLFGKVDSLPIVADGGSLVGLVTSSDILEIAAGVRDMARLPFRFEVQVHEDHRPSDRRIEPA